MYFKKLELVGFKSFLSKTTLNFEPGITAVVGPNGCGKSNIFDSIRWVLGEQSVKSLRGSDMQDVIFNGTDSKEPLSMAEVTLTFDNNNRFFNVDHNEVAVTRRIFRSGESEYLLNKAQVRLKDILDLLMGTGIGAESYSLVEQGKIDLVLSSRPEDRRLVFDEASGITKYKAQKREALRRLEETEQNLARVNDIITEVRRQIGHLERQANKARRYKEVFEELKSKEVGLAVLERNTLLEQKNRIIEQIGELERQGEKLWKAIEEQEAKISNRQTELKKFEDEMLGVKNEILNLENLAIRNRERISFNQERIRESEKTRQYLETQIKQIQNKILLDEEKLKNLQKEHDSLGDNIQTKTRQLNENEGELNALASCIKTSLVNIAKAKAEIMELVKKIADAKNAVNDAVAKQQIYLARKRRLELEKAKVGEEKGSAEDNLKTITGELESLDEIIGGLNAKISQVKEELERETADLNGINSEIEGLEKQKLTLESHKEFIEKLKTKYKDISESMNAVVYLDKLPADKITGLVIKLNSLEEANLKYTGEAKPFDLDTQKIDEKIIKIQEAVDSLRTVKNAKEARREELSRLIQELGQQLRSQEITLANKKANHSTASEQFNKIKDEEGIISLELEDVDKEVSSLEDKLTVLKASQAGLENEHRHKDETILAEQNSIALNTELKEKVLVAIAQAKTELDALVKRTDSEEATLKMLEETYRQDKEASLDIESQIKEVEDKKEALARENQDLENKIQEQDATMQNQNKTLKEKEDAYRQVSDGASEWVKKIEADRKELDTLKNKLYESQMQNKDVDFRISSIKDRISQVYKVDLETIQEAGQEAGEDMLSQEIQKLKDKLDSYGTVNLVAIEEYDELKKRYDFLTQQQNDLVSGKDSLHEAILKINRTTKKMFLETFEKVKEEFRGYFRLLFNGGDAQIFLVDEQDPLESGIEIICRPPGKKLQNVLLLSGGEKAMSAIALIFAIFKVKPSPFCVLDEIDAALDEANVERFSRILQEFVRISQFIVITHNKRTIANADVMYGITMEESGVSKIVSVKFGSRDALKDKEPGMAVAGPV